MPYVALNTDERRVKPSQVDKPADLWCPECSRQMHIVQTHEHRDTFRSRHFSHNPDRSAGGGGGGSGCGGESDRHVQMKQIALHKLEWEYDVAQARTEQEVGDRVADVYTRFESPHDRYGYGIIAEAQYQNKDKDLEAVTQEYLEHGYSVVWLWEDQYSNNDVNLAEGTWHTVWPDMVPHPGEWSWYAGGHDWQLLHSNGKYTPDKKNLSHIWQADSSLFSPYPKREVRLPPEWCDDEAQRIWRGQDWSELFSPGVETGDFWDFSEVPVTLPSEQAEQIERRVWRETEWPARFTPGHTLDIEQETPDQECPIPFAAWAANDGEHSPLREEFEVLLDSPSDVASTGGFADIICLSCAARWYYTEPHSKRGVWKACPECGSEVDFAEQVEAGHISTTEATEAVRSPTAPPVHPREYENRR